MRYLARVCAERPACNGDFQFRYVLEFLLHVMKSRLIKTIATIFFSFLFWTIYRFQKRSPIILNAFQGNLKEMRFLNGFDRFWAFTKTNRLVPCNKGGRTLNLMFAVIIMIKQQVFVILSLCASKHNAAFDAGVL